MYDQEKELENVMQAIEEHTITDFQDIALYVSPSKRTMEGWDFHKLPTIKEALEKNKIKRKAKMRKKWEDSDNATLQIAAFKLLADTDELNVLNTSKVQAEHTGKDGGPLKYVVEILDNGGSENTEQQGIPAITE